MFKLLVLASLIVPAISLAETETIEIDSDELATESVLPVFDKTNAVLNRKIKTKKRFEAGAGLGLNLGEALYDPLTFNFDLSYHFDEIHGLNFQGILTNQGLSAMGGDLREGKGLTGRTFDASLAPSPEYYLLANYQYTTYYGKLSINKLAVMNIMQYWLLGLGVVSFGDSNSIVLNGGLGQKFYFSEKMALRFDLQLAIYEGPDPTQPKTNQNFLRKGDAALGSDQFESVVFFRSFLSVAFNYLF